MSPSLADARRMLVTMFELQEAHNLQVATDWRTRGLAFERAIWVECAELLDHFGWKWWKLQRPDVGQVQLEIVDIWHFGLSCLMLQPAAHAGPALDAMAGGFLELPALDPAAPVGESPEIFRRAVEQVARAALDGRFEVADFVAVLRALPMSYRQLFEMYVGKNVLNRFRHANGYADGSYRKLWAGREDNLHLLELTATLDPGRADYVDALHDVLAARYRATAPAA